MDGNLLDPETADETLAKDWNLPELPEGSSSLPSTSQELAEIFGTSDDEDDVGFPFSLSSGLPGEFSLPSTGTKKFENSLLESTDSEMFLNTFHDALSSMPTVPVSISQSLDAQVDMKEGVGASNNKKNEGVSDDKGAELMETNATNEADNDQRQTTTEVKDATGGTTKVEAPQLAPVLRKSARLRQRHTTDHEVQESSNNAAAATKIKQEPNDGAAKVAPAIKVEVDEKPKVSDGAIKKEEAADEPVKEEDRRYVKSESVGEEESDTSEEEEESDEDPDRLWCICRQPHDDRFMICCDQCGEWYHGDCVGISVSQGKRMEREGKEYVCPVCISRLQDAKEERDINRTERQARREQTREKELKKKVGQVRRRISSGSGASHAPKPEDDQYGMAQLFLPDNAPKEKKGELAKPSPLMKIKKEESVSHCVGPGCEKPTKPPSVYCSQDCIEKHAAYSLKKLSDRGVLHSSNPSEFVRGAGGVSVVEKGTGMLLIGVAAPSEKNLVPWLKEHPSYQVYLHTKGGKKIKDKTNKKPKVEKKEPESPKIPKIPLMDPKSVRANAKKALFQTLWKRCEDAPDLSDVDQEAVEKVANDIEEKLHNLYQDINPKYKNKYRSLLFNLKDTRNQGLFRKVLHREIDTRQLVRMSSEKLASEDLAQWRVQTIKRDLEKIKEREEEVGALGGTIRKMTYKGEVEIEHSDEHLETIDTSKDYLVSGKSNSKPSKSQSDSTKSNSQSSKSQPQISSPKKPSGSILDLLTDTTSQHHSHIYDHHCAICSGKMKKPPSPPCPKEPSSDSSHPSPDSHAADNEPMDATSPDTADLDDVPGETVVWRGDFTMHGMAKFSATAYAVSGPVEYLDEILPPVLEVMGRIAHVQVWDYVDKLRSSTSRDIVVLRFEQVDEDSEAYLAMLNYLVGKHRCGVIKSGYHGIKDMYLLPLLRHNPVATQLLPFDGPGLPYDRSDTLLGVIVRSKNKKRPSVSQRLATKSAASAPPAAILPTLSDTGIKRHNSASDEMYGGKVVKRSRFQLEVGFGNETPPVLDQEEQKDGTDDDSPYEPGSLDPEVKEGEERLMKKIQMSFYGEHRPMESTTEATGASKVAQGGSSSGAPSESISGTAGGSLELSLQSSNIQSLLSQLSKEKFEELASVVSSVRGQTAAGAEITTATGVTTVNQSPIKTTASKSGSVDMGSSSTIGRGGLQPQQSANYNTVVGQDVNAQMATAQAQWSQDQVQKLPQRVPPAQQHAQFYQAGQYSGHAEQHSIQQSHPGAVCSNNSEQFQQRPVYPPPTVSQAQEGSPYGNYPHGQNRADSSSNQQLQPPHGHHPSHHHGHTHQQWEQHHNYRQDYGRGGHSDYHDRGHGYRGENREPPRGPPHHHSSDGWREGHAHEGHRVHQYHGREHNRYRDHWHGSGRGGHDRGRQWR